MTATTNTLSSALTRIVDAKGDSNQIGLTYSAEYGWRVSWQRTDREDGAVAVINLDQLNEWAGGAEWDESTLSACEDWIQSNLGEWLN